METPGTKLYIDDDHDAIAIANIYTGIACALSVFGERFCNPV
jgi:hypothetical protein